MQSARSLTMGFGHRAMGQAFFGVEDIWIYAAKYNGPLLRRWACCTLWVS